MGLVIFFITLITIFGILRHNKKMIQKYEKNTILAGFVSDYDLICQIDINQSSVTLFQISEFFRKIYSKIDSSLPSNIQLDNFFKEIIVPNDFEQFLLDLSPNKVTNILSKKASYITKFRININDKILHYQIKYTCDKIKKNCYVMGIKNVDYETKKDKENQKLKQSLQETTLLAYKDPLTGVGSANALKNRMDELNKSIKNGNKSPFAVIVCDLNNLKQVNDSFGHSAGNEFIKNNCNVFCEVFKHSPVYRAGGDEFLILGHL